MTGKQHRRSVADRARRRAIRAHAESLGISYTAAARLLKAKSPQPARGLSGAFPVGADEHRAWLFAMREQRSFGQRLADTAAAVDLPLGRAAHLTERFPPLRRLRNGSPDDAGRAEPVAALYDGEGRQAMLGLLYHLLRHESPHLVPAEEEFEWVASLGEETAVDIVCAGLDRAARRCLEDDGWRLWTRMEAALAAGEADPDRAVRAAAIALGSDFRTMIPRKSLHGARNILDALLAIAYDGHQPGTLVRVVCGPARGRVGTVLGACWHDDGPPAGYRVCVGADVMDLLPGDVEPLDLPAQQQPALT